MNTGHKQTDVIVMDFAEAFDKVPHKRLLYKLDFYGIRGSTHKWIDSWLSDRSNLPIKTHINCVIPFYIHQRTRGVPELSELMGVF